MAELLDIARFSNGLALFKVRFGLSSSPVFSRTDTVTDSERFYNTVLDLFDDIDEREEVNDLLTWWNRYVKKNSHFLNLVQFTAVNATVRYFRLIRQRDGPFARTVH